MNEHLSLLAAASEAIGASLGWSWPSVDKEAQTLRQVEHTVVVGGGLAGIACAAALADAGCRVTLLEEKSRLGGRATSFVDPATGELIDNCQHVSMGCCTAFSRFCQMIGIDADIETQRELHFLGRDGVLNRFASSPLPAPLHLANAFRSISYLSFSDLRSITRAVRRLVRTPAEHSGSFAEWLESNRQTQTQIDRFWNIVLISALSETAERIGVKYARKVIVDAFLKNRHGWEVQIPTRPLHELYGDTMMQWFNARDCEIRTESSVRSLKSENGSATAAILNNGSRVEADAFVLALPSNRFADVLPGGAISDAELQGAAELRPAAITSVHLWYDRPVTELPHVVLVDRTSQWVFNRSRLHKESATNRHSYYLQVVISASHDLADRTPDALTTIAIRDIAEAFPGSEGATVLHSKVITERRAVFSPAPNVDAQRPQQRTNLANLVLAGDWTFTEWPSTMEGAVRSGFLAAEVLTDQAGLICPAELPASFLPRILFGIR